MEVAQLMYYHTVRALTFRQEFTVGKHTFHKTFPVRKQSLQPNNSSIFVNETLAIVANAEIGKFLGDRCNRAVHVNLFEVTQPHWSSSQNE